MSDISNFFILTMSLFMYDKDINATRNSLTAYYKQSGYERNLNNYVDKIINPELRSKVGNLIFITNIITEKRIAYEFSF